MRWETAVCSQQSRYAVVRFKQEALLPRRAQRVRRT